MFRDTIVICVCASAFSLAAVGAELLLSEDFRGASATEWTFVTGQGLGPSLTADTGGDAVGEGWLRLTENEENQASFVYHNDPISTVNGLVIEFDFVIWGGGDPNGADGFVFALFDSSVTPDAGGYGGSLGYAQRSGIDGLAGGIAGFGFDEFGNYSRASEGRVGGPGSRPNALAIRGSQGATRADGYEYQTGTESLTGFSFPGVASRADATVHSARIEITTEKVVTVDWRRTPTSDWETLIDDYQCTLTCPEQVRVGFTSGTGAVTNNHEVRDLTIRQVPEPSGCLLLIALLPLLSRGSCRTLSRHSRRTG